MIPFADGGLEPRRWRTFENLACLAQTESSNDLARELIELYFDEEQEFPPSVVVAESQPAARGRTGRWHAPPGRGLYFTLIVPAKGTLLSVVPIAVARWTREAVSEATGVVSELKWPNDLYVGRRKLAGILPEARTQGDRTMLAVGIGLNVSGSAESLGVPNATTLEQEAGRPIPRAALLQTLLDRIDRELVEPDWEREIAAWERASLHRPGDRMTIRREGEELTGEYLGLDPSGFLRLKTERGVTVFPAGEVAEW
jgi:BirA family transcriptional regulator, biotin operon repressor / biotin---[acetyl-CoA-carboxylase] ligase